MVAAKGMFVSSFSFFPPRESKSERKKTRKWCFFPHFFSGCEEVRRSTRSCPSPNSLLSLTRSLSLSRYYPVNCKARISLSLSRTRSIEDGARRRRRRVFKKREEECFVLQSSMLFSPFLLPLTGPRASASNRIDILALRSATEDIYTVMWTD